MKSAQNIKQKKAISPIIATLLLILIAIAAGVVVYAYVIGFVGNSTSNAGGSTDSLSVDQLYLTHVTTSAPVTAYVRNLGPSSESYNNGFTLKTTNLNLILGPAVTVLVTLGGTTPAATIASVALAYVSATSISVAVTLAAACTGTAPTIALTVNGLGGTAGTLAATSCSGGAGPYSATITALSVTASSTFAAATGAALALSVVSGTTYTFGTSVSLGTLSSAVNTVAALTLAPQTTTSNVNTNPLSAGTTYTIQVTGTDGASTTSSNKAT
ncbi:MAG TPA: archaellin/type IV pilin N-terminal domain-containing protein [Nitrososphaerales archaeon]|nr:archaellin/type IV pilin N-terminal domain-containing protein [Nitrososphaerales archaeon]